VLGLPRLVVVAVMSWASLPGVTVCVAPPSNNGVRCAAAAGCRGKCLRELRLRALSAACRLGMEKSNHEIPEWCSLADEECQWTVENQAALDAAFRGTV
jgi:hypothetical protein